MDCIQTRSRKLLSASLAANTHTTYRNSITAFNNFRMHHKLEMQMPTTVKQVQYFISGCLEKGSSPATIKTYCLALVSSIKLMNLQIQQVILRYKRCLNDGVAHENRMITEHLSQNIC